MEQPLDTQTASTSAEKPNEVDKSAGEDFQSGKISARNRSSAETLIIVEDNHRQSNDNSTEDLNADPKGPPKTMKDCLGIEEGEPSSIIQAVLDDFGTDSEESSQESPIENGESVNEDTNKKSGNNEGVIVIVHQEAENIELIDSDLIIVDEGKKVEEGPTSDTKIITKVSSNELVNWLNECGEEVEKQTEENDEVNKEKETGKTTNISNEAVTSSDYEVCETVEDSEPIVIEDNSETAENVNKESIENDNNNQNSLSATNDTIIPNNQEILNTEVNKTNGISKEAVSNEVATRKRSSSQEDTKNKKKKLNNSPKKTNGDVEATPTVSDNTEALFEANKNVDNAQKTQDAPVNVESHENPCLNSVSLFEEQFNTTKYIDSEDEETPIPKNSVKQPEESIVNNDVSTKLNKKAECVKNNKTEKPTQEEVVIVKTKSPTQNKEAIEAQGNQSKIDLTLTEQDNVSKSEKQQLNKKEVILLETDNETAPYSRKIRKVKNALILSSNSESDELERVHESNKERLKRLSQAFGFVPGKFL